jgi:hypothetical protein
LAADFIKKYHLKPDFVSSHGHTIFHQPEKKLTVQIGSGSVIAAECNLPVVCDFRSLDVALGGQGAPLVPVGDKLLFSEFDFCLNLGGFANVSYHLPSPHGERAGGRCAFDISPVNIVMNAICAKLGKEYDNEGELARKGTIHEPLLRELNELSFYKLPLDSPKSLGKEWVIKNESRFKAVLKEGERLCGEWLIQAHGTRYNLPHEPLVIFDLMVATTRTTYDKFIDRVSVGDFITPKLLHQGTPLSIEQAMIILNNYGFHGAIDNVEGAVWRVERNELVHRGRTERQLVVDFLAKYVRPDKEDGCYLPERTKLPPVTNTWEDK